MREAVAGLWPEIQWIENKALREQVMQTWVKALERSPLRPDDLNQIPFTLLVPNCPITFMEHRRAGVNIAGGSAKERNEFMGLALPIDIEKVFAGAILADVGNYLNMRSGLMARAGRASAARRCAIRLREYRWRWSAECRMPSATSLRRTRRKGIW